MIVFLLLVCLTVLAVHLRLAPTCYAVHAGLVADLPSGVKPVKKVPSPQVYITGKTERFSRKNRFYGVAVGGSMEAYGIPDGAEFFGTLVPSEMGTAQRIEYLSALKDPIVVIDCPTERSETGKRLRCISKIEADGSVEFYPYFNGKKHTVRHVSDVVCVVEMVSV